MRPAVVVGGGLTGLVTAHRLQQAGAAAVVLEAGREPGGACRSLERDGYVFDFTAHLLHVQRPETEAYLQEMEVWSRLVDHARRAAIMVGTHVTPYPIQIHTHGLAAEVRRDCVLGFIRAWGAGEASPDPQHFAEWVLGRFGEGFAHHFFFPYNRKLFRAEPEELTVDWLGRYVPRPELEEVVNGAFGLHDAAVGYNASFRYPQSGGIRLLPDAVAARVQDLRLGERVVGLHLGERWLELADGERTAFDELVSTISLPSLIDLIRDPLPEAVAEARRRLRWVRVVNLALGVRGPAPRPEHWLYFPASDLSFYRVGFPSNHGQMAPPGCHTVSVELSLNPGEDELEPVADRAGEDLHRLGMLDPSRVEVRMVNVLDPAYVVYDRHRNPAVAELRRFLGDHRVTVSGRWAEWKYSAMEDAILDGMATAKKVVQRLGG
jgi:protoporphyrinogen oxidase